MKTDLDTQEWGFYRPRGLPALCLATSRLGLLRGWAKKYLRRTLPNIRSQWDIEVAGIKLRCHLGDNLTEERLATGRGHMELPSVARITDGLRSGDVFVDVGANCGLYSLFAARKVGPFGRVIAIEPMPAMIARLKFNVTANKFTNVTIWEKAIGDTEGIGELFINSNQHGQSTMRSIEGYAPIMVSISSLLSAITNAGVSRVHAMKLDIEGYEDRALIPFLKYAPSGMWPLKILIETKHHDHWKGDLFATLATCGYDVAWYSQRDALFVRR